MDREITTVKSNDQNRKNKFVIKI